MTTPETSNTPSDSGDPPESSTTPLPPSSDSQDSSTPSSSRSGGIMGMLRRNLLVVGIGGVVAVVIVVVVILLVSGVFGGGGGGTADLQNVILEDSRSVSVINVAAILAAEEIPAQLPEFVPLSVPSVNDDYDPVDWKDDWRDDWEYNAEDYGFILDEVDNIMIVSGQFTYSVVTGNFLLGDLRNSLEDAGYEDDEYRDLEIWEDGGQAVGVLESSGKRVVVGGSVDDVQEVLKAIDREEGFVDDESVLKQALDSAGDSLALNSNTGCSSEFFSNSLRGCEAGLEFITGGDLDTTKLSGVYVFSSDRRAESGVEDLEDAIEDQDYYDVDLDEIQFSGLKVTHKVTIYED